MFSPIFILSLLVTAFVAGGNAAPPNSINGTDGGTNNTSVIIPSGVPAPVKITCNIPGFADARVSAINSGISYLDGLKGDATLGHQDGGGWCWRYSCSYESGIYGCNDAQADAQVSYAAMAWYASQIRDKCNFSGFNGKLSQGQAFSPDGWNVIVGIRLGTNC